MRRAPRFSLLIREHEFVVVYCFFFFIFYLHPSPPTHVHADTMRLIIATRVELINAL